MPLKALLTGVTRTENGTDFDWNRVESGPLSRLVGYMKKTPAESDGPAGEDVWTRTKRVCERLTALPEFVRLTGRRQDELLLAALLHDVGTFRSVREENGAVSAPYHAPNGARIARQLLWEECGLCGTPELQSVRETVCALIRFHNVPAFASDGAEGAARLRMTASNGVMIPDFTLSLLCLLAEADRGRDAGIGIETTKAVARREGFFDVSPALSPKKDAWGEIMMMCGLPGTGKDTWLRTYHPDLPQICLDDIREETGTSPTADQSAVVALAMERAREHLRLRTPFVWNATSVSPRTRRGEIELFRSHGAAVRIVWLETAWTEELARNRGRERIVPESAIRRMLGTFEPPFPCEVDYVDWFCI